MSAGAPLSGLDAEGGFRPRVMQWAQEAPTPWRWAAAVALSVLVVLIGVGLTRTPLFAVDRIDVVGISNITREDALAAARVSPGRPMVSIDEKAVVRRLEALPWVADARVATDWPSAVRLEVTERKPLLLAQTSDNRWAQVGEGGIVVAVTDKPVGGLPVPIDVKAPSTPGAVLDASAGELLQVAAMMPPSLQAKVTQLQRRPNGDLRLGLSSGVIVELGDARQLSDKLMAAATVLSNADSKNVTVLDVRSPHLPLATPKTTAPPAPTSTTTAAPGPDGATATTVRPATRGATTTTARPRT